MQFCSIPILPSPQTWFCTDPNTQNTYYRTTEANAILRGHPSRLHMPAVSIDNIFISHTSTVYIVSKKLLVYVSIDYCPISCCASTNWEYNTHRLILAAALDCSRLGVEYPAICLLTFVHTYTFVFA